MYGPTLAEIQAQNKTPPTQQHKNYRVLKVFLGLAAILFIDHWAHAFRDVVMFDLGWGGVEHFNGSALMGVAWMSVVGVGIAKSVSKRKGDCTYFWLDPTGVCAGRRSGLHSCESVRPIRKRRGRGW
jgi:hypothetical protein